MFADPYWQPVRAAGDFSSLLRGCVMVVCASCAVFSHTEADVSSQCLLEANVSTEVCLTVLDTLSIFIMGFKVGNASSYKLSQYVSHFG